MIEHDDIKDAWDRVARGQATAEDGLTIYRHLQFLRMVVIQPGEQKRALPFNEGRRSLAADLMAYMADGIGANDRASVTFSIAKRSDASSRPRGIGRRVTPDSIVSGWNTPDEFAAADATTGNGKAS